MKTPEGLTKGKDIFSGSGSHCRFWMDFSDQITQWCCLPGQLFRLFGKEMSSFLNELNYFFY